MYVYICKLFGIRSGLALKNVLLFFFVCVYVYSDEDGSRHHPRHGREGSGAASTTLERRIEELERVRFRAFTIKIKLLVLPTAFHIRPVPNGTRSSYQSSPIVGSNCKNVNISAGFWCLRAIFWLTLNDWCHFWLSLCTILTFHWKTPLVAALLRNSMRPNPVPFTLKWQHTYKPGTHTNSLSYTDIKFNFSLGSVFPVSPELF